ncbi:MAG TPA: pilus assembly PilX N-terminal domain-containing protein [Verrucomicrobiae bacterium]|jgi:Tfp pilus assembly protein PilX|nr:pilus assembly PilX N-terminal domain-containing protein [Verrucomicrobiae bacterium]
MRVHRWFRPLTDERGAALPMALFATAILITLVIAFSILSSSEPTIAGNQQMVAQARAIAESGVERAAWALNNAANTDGLADPMPATVPAPYDGSAAIPVALTSGTLGSFRVTVAQGAATNERIVESVGTIPNDTSPRAKQRIRVTLIKFKFPTPPAALSVRGELQVGGNTYIDSRADTSCGAKVGTFTTGTTTVQDAATGVYGADGNNTKNESTDILQNQPTAAFDQYLLSDEDMAALKSYAKSQGTYYQGAVEFSASSRMPNGVIFVDTVSGSPMTAGSDPNDQASVTIHGNAPESSDGIFHGWLIINGRLAIDGNFQMWGYGYVMNDLTYTGTGTGQIVGAMLSRNIQDTSSTTIDTNTGGNASVIYDCAKARSGGGMVPQTYTAKSGTYREVSE